jgi:hypothetical protein
MCRKVIGLRHVELMDQPSCPRGLLGKLWVIGDVYGYQAISAHALTECQSPPGSHFERLLASCSRIGRHSDTSGRAAISAAMARAPSSR